jgi:hypothetical protein
MLARETGLLIVKELLAKKLRGAGIYDEKNSRRILRLIRLKEKVRLSRKI